MGYPAQNLPQPRSAVQSWPRKAGFFRSLDYGNIARMAGMVGLGVFAYKTMKLMIYGKAASIAYDKTRQLLH